MFKNSVNGIWLAALVAGILPACATAPKPAPAAAAAPAPTPPPKPVKVDPRAKAMLSGPIDYYNHSERVTDFLIALARATDFSAPTYSPAVTVMLSLFPLAYREDFDCERFWNGLSEAKRAVVEKRLAGHPFVCWDSAATLEGAVASFDELLSPKIDNRRRTDAHWAWYGVTGDTAVLRRFLDNYLDNPGACRDCIARSFAMNAVDDKRVSQFLALYIGELKDRKKIRALQALRADAQRLRKRKKR